ncbi:MAG TPA: serine/threonine-protein kinase [Myxococcaceae bacterium]
MERVRSEVATEEGTVTCPGCGTAAHEARCGHCGVALHAGGYRVLQVLSQGPHARLYLAEDEAGQRVALKELLFALLPSTAELEAFERESTLLRELRHPNIPRFVRGFTEGSGVHTRLYLAQEHVPGASLAQELERRTFSEEQVRAIAEEVLGILDHLHRRSPKVLHRDIKPANIVRGGDGRWVLVDFGSARNLAGAQTHRATLVGTFGYMPPEQLGGTVDERSDLFALGATLIHLLSGKAPETMLGSGLTLDFQRHVECSAHLEQFLSRLVARKPESRFASAREALAFLRGQSQRPGFHRNAFGISLAAALALLAAGALVSRYVSQPGTKVVEAPVQRPQPVAPERPKEAPRPPPVQEVLAEGEEEVLEAIPPSDDTFTFDWVIAKWDFSRPGRWVQDTSGHNHHALVPASGVRGTFGGLEFLGTTGVVELADREDFLLAPPFTIQAHAKVLSAKNERGILVRRGDASGQEAFVLETRSEGLLRFTMTQQDGQPVFIEGKLPKEADRQHFMIYATIDARGEMTLYAGCELVGRAQLKGPPRLRLDPKHNPQLTMGGLKGHRFGFHGSIWTLELMRGVMEKVEGPGCSFSLRSIR